MKKFTKISPKRLSKASSYIAFSIISIATTCLGTEIPLNRLKLPPGFTISIYAEPVQNAREMTLGSKGTLFVGSLSAGNVYAIVPDTHSPHGTQILTIASGLTMPNGVAFHNNALYVAENDKIVRFNDIENHLQNPPKPETIAKLPNKKHHGWRYIRFGPDGKLYVSIGAPCNVCLSKEDIFATIIRMDPDGSNMEIYAKGIRNSVGFDWDPATKNLWFTDNGRDWMGDYLPPDELNIATTKGQHFGFPYCHGKNIPDPIFNLSHPCSQFTAPVLELPAHVAPLGMCFYRGDEFPKEYHNQIFIAEHGSWNRSTKIGYQVISVKVTDNHVIDSKPFVTGWLKGQTALGRPVDVLNFPDGSLLISDDFANVLYKVEYSKH
jgi:glucose/arabinose dehydrogenase